jgi:MFS family permease
MAGGGSSPGGTDNGWRDFLAEGRGARLALICLGVWLNAADALVTTTVMPTVVRSLGGYAVFSWATAAYMTGAILSGATAAALAARTGLRAAMIGAGLVTAAGCAASALAPDMLVFVAGRAAQGLGAGWILGACYAAIGAMFPVRHLARVLGLMSGVWGVAVALGPLLGGVFSGSGPGSGLWRWLFWTFAAQNLLFVAVAPSLTPRGEARTVAGAPWRQLALVLLGVALIGAADITADVRGAALLGLASVVAFVVAFRARTAHGLFPRDAGAPATLIGAGYLSFFAQSAAAIGFSVYGPALLQKLHGLSPLESGYSVGMESVGWTVAALATAGLPVRWHGLLIRTGGVSIAVGLALLAATMWSGPLLAIFAAALVLGVGFGLSNGFMSRRMIAAAGEGERDLASAGANSVRLIGNAAGACLAGAVANFLGLASGIGEAAARAAAVWLFVLAVPIAVLAAVAAWRVGVRDAPEMI